MIRLGDLASHVNGRLVGDENIEISQVAGIQHAKEGEITFLSHARYAKFLRDCKASAIFIGKDFPLDKLRHINVIVVDNPSLAYIAALQLFTPPQENTPGISKFAVISEETIIAEDASVAPYVYIGKHSIIHSSVTIHPFVHVGNNVTIAEGSTLYPHVTIYDNTIIGRNVTVHSGSVIGSDGFGYVWNGTKHVKIPHVGKVVIEDDVEIGANVTIDRSELSETVIKKGTKIDNLVQIAHNVSIGEHSIIIAQTGISGSVSIGRNVVLAGQTGIADHVSVGDGVMAGGRAGITGDVPSGSLVSGTPHMPHKDWLKVNIYLKKLPLLFQRIKRIEKRLNLEDSND